MKTLPKSWAPGTNLFTSAKSY